MSLRSLALSIFVLCAFQAVGALEALAGGSALDMIFVLDNSGSMKESDPDFVIRSVVRSFAAELDASARIGIVLFDQDARLVLPLDPVGPNQTLGATLLAIDYRGQLTNSPAGIERALYELRSHGREDAQRAIVFVTDGIVDTGDRIRDAEKKRWLKEGLAAEAQRAGVRIFGIALSDGADVELIQALSVRTDGEYFRVASAGDIRGVFGRIAANLRERASEAVAAQPPPAVPPPVAAPAPSPMLPPVAFVLGFGVVLGLALIAYPLFQRRHRAAAGPRAAPPIADLHVAPRPGQVPRPAAISSTGPQPVAKLVDVGKVSVGSLLPHSIDRTHTAVGRDSSNDIVIPRETISSFHATIDYRGGYYYLEDHRSTNGTYLNGGQLHENQPVQLKSGDQIDFSDYEFRFIIPDHEPRGRTAILESSSLPPETSWVMSPAREEPSELAEAETDAPQGELFGSAAPREPLSPVEAFDACLQAHLDKIRALGSEHRAFVDGHFDAELQHALLRKAEEQIGACEIECRGQQAELSRAGVHYTLCVLPLDMDEAADWYREEHGGYARFLVRQLDVWAAADRRCDVLCVISFGLIAEPWISITVLPASEQAESIEVMSFEFLSEQERRRALSLEIAEVGGSD